MEEIYDVIVVGAGIEGSSTAYQLAKSGQKTLLLEQFPLPHSRGSSHGQSRITRMAYGDWEYYTIMMKESYKLWEQLERESGKSIYRQTGLLTIGTPTDAFTTGTIRCLQRHNISHEVFDSKEMQQRYPMMNFPEQSTFVMDHSGGILRADRALEAYQTMFCRFGGVLRDGEPVVKVTPGQTVVVQTERTAYKGRVVVLTVGAWATKLLPSIGLKLPLQVLRINVLYWKEKQAGRHSSSNFPVIIQEDAIENYAVYGLPSEEYPGLVKICLHWGPEVDPDFRDRADDTWIINEMKKYIQKHFPELEPIPAISETCLYTMTKDEDFILDRHPSWRNIIIGAGFSGHGFKLAPVVGKILSELAMGKTTILYKIKLNKIVSTIPTVGFNVEKLQPVLGLTFTVWDLGGEDRIRPLWKQFLENTDGLVYVVDSSDRARLEESREELFSILDNDEMRGVPVVVIANKQDVQNAMKPSEVADAMRLENLTSNKWYIQAACAKTGHGIYESMVEMSNLVNHSKINKENKCIFCNAWKSIATKFYSLKAYA